MRKIEKEMLQAIIAKRNWSKDNTRVEIQKGSEDFISVFLHGHLIATIIDNKQTKLFHLSHCGYATRTTLSRLRAICAHYNLDIPYIKDFTWHWNRDNTSRQMGYIEQKSLSEEVSK